MRFTSILSWVGLAKKASPTEDWQARYERQSRIACLALFIVSLVLWAASGLPQNASTTLAAAVTILVVPLIYGVLAMGCVLAGIFIAGAYAWGRAIFWLGRGIGRAVLAQTCFT